MILHIPHSSTNTLDKKFLCNLEVELNRMTDFDTDKLFDYSDATKIIFPVSRLICDVERFEDDDLEEMSKKGMGVCYTENAFGEPLREVTEQERSHIIKKYYQPHHRKLTDAVQQELNEHNTAIVIDCHSFPDKPLPCNISQKIPRPDICIGTDSFHTSDNLLNKTVDYFKSCGYTVAINDPFTGTLIPMKYYQQDKRVQGIMIEVNRDLYKDDFEIMRQNITDCLKEINI